MRYTINIATRTYLDHRVLNRLGFCVIALLLAMSVWHAGEFLSNMGEQNRLSAEIAAIQSGLDHKLGGVSAADLSSRKDRIRFYNEIIERKSKNWLDILELFESVTPEGISLSLLSQSKNPEEWKLEGRARTFKTIRQYLEKLESSKNFSQVLLLSHQKMAQGDKMPGMQFTISCKVLH